MFHSTTITDRQNFSNQKKVGNLNINWSWKRGPTKSGQFVMKIDVLQIRVAIEYFG